MLNVVSLKTLIPGEVKQQRKNGYAIAKKTKSNLLIGVEGSRAEFLVSCFFFKVSSPEGDSS